MHVMAVGDQSAALCRVVGQVAAVPYVWPGEPSAASVRAKGVGTCASKHALLAEELAALGIASSPVLVVGPLVPALVADDPAFAAARDLREVHELLTVSVPGVGPCRVDVTWDPPLVRAGLPGQVGWDGCSDMALAVGETTEWWAPDRARLREEKEAVRARIYGPGEREVRDAALGALSERFAALRR